jgi:hypothetical protein
MTENFADLFSMYSWPMPIITAAKAITNRPLANWGTLLISKVRLPGRWETHSSALSSKLGTESAASLSSEGSAGFLSLLLNGPEHFWKASASVPAF